MAFAEERLDLGIRYGSAGGPEFNTSIITVQSGFEQRNANWADSRASWNLAEDVYSKAELEYMISFFRARRGKFEGFRYRDWSDYDVIQGFGEFRATDTPQLMQLVKKYNSTPINQGVPGSLYFGGYGTTVADRYREISKPVPQSVRLFMFDVTEIFEGTDYFVDTTTGQVQLINLDYYPPSVFSWVGEFDVPVRFDTDKFSSTFEAYRESDREAIYTVTSLPIVEIRIDTTF